jgi:hypothetical protein
MGDKKKAAASIDIAGINTAPGFVESDRNILIEDTIRTNYYKI